MPTSPGPSRLDGGSRRAARELAKNALELLGSFPDMDMLNVLTHNLKHQPPEGEHG